MSGELGFVASQGYSLWRDACIWWSAERAWGSEMQSNNLHPLWAVPAPRGVCQMGSWSVRNICCLSLHCLASARKFHSRSSCLVSGISRPVIGGISRFWWETRGMLAPYYFIAWDDEDFCFLNAANSASELSDLARTACFKPSFAIPLASMAEP